MALISESFARELARIRRAPSANVSGRPWRQDGWREVIGVVQDIRDVGIYEEAPTLGYWPALVADFFGRPFVGMPAPTLVIRSERAGIESFADEIRQTIWSVDGAFPSPPEARCRIFMRLARANVVRARIARDRGRDGVGARRDRDLRCDGLRRLAENPGDRNPSGARGRAAGTREDVLAARTHTRRSGAAMGIAAAAALGRSMQSLLFGVSAWILPPISAHSPSSSWQRRSRATCPRGARRRSNTMETLKQE